MSCALFQRQFFGYGFPALKDRFSPSCNFRNSHLADFFYRSVVDCMGITGGAVEILIEQAMVAKKTCHRYRYGGCGFQTSSTNDVGSMAVSMHLRPQMICSVVPKLTGTRKASAHQSQPATAILSKSLPQSFLLTCSCVLAVMCTCCSSRHLKFTDGIHLFLPHHFLHQFRSVRKWSLAIMCVGCRPSPAASELQATNSGPLTRVDNGRAPRANSFPAPLHENPSLHIGRKATWLHHNIRGHQTSASITVEMLTGRRRCR